MAPERLKATTISNVVIGVRKYPSCSPLDLSSIIALPDDLHRALAIATIEDRTVMTELVRRAVQEWLKRRERKKARKATSR